MQIAFICLPNILATSLTNAYELFYIANEVSKKVDRRQAKAAKLNKLAEDLSPLILPSGLSFNADRTWDETAVYDLVYVPALWRSPKPALKRYQSLVEWLQYQYENGAILNATGTGACFLAETGLLNQRPATTHWHYFDQFTLDYPNIQLKRQHFITQAGRLFCAASINAQTDLCLHHIHRFYGQQVASHLSQHFSHEVRQPFDRLNFDQAANTNHADEEILQSQLWLQSHLGDNQLNIKQLAQIFGMSSRNYNRRFQQATGQSPSQYLQGLRMTEARELLQNSNLTIGEISFRVGYLDGSHFSALFKRFNNVTPRQFRIAVRAKLFSDNYSH